MRLRHTFLPVGHKHTLREQPPSCHSQVFFLPGWPSKRMQLGIHSPRGFHRGETWAQQEPMCVSSPRRPLVLPPAFTSPVALFSLRLSWEIYGRSQQAGRLPQVVLGGQGWNGGGVTKNRDSQETWHKEGSRQALSMRNCWGHVGALVQPQSPVPGVSQEE